MPAGAKQTREATQQDLAAATEVNPVEAADVAEAEAAIRDMQAQRALAAREAEAQRAAAERNPTPQSSPPPQMMNAAPPAEATVAAPPVIRRVWVFETTPTTTDTGVATGYALLLDAGNPGISAMIDPQTGFPVGRRPHRTIKWKMTTVPGPDGQAVPACVYSTDNEQDAMKIMADEHFKGGKIRLRPEKVYSELEALRAREFELMRQLGRIPGGAPAPPIQPREYPPATPPIRLPMLLVR